MTKHIIQIPVIGQYYCEIEADNEEEAVKIAHSKYANKEIETETGIRLKMEDDIGAYYVCDKIYP